MSETPRTQHAGLPNRSRKADRKLITALLACGVAAGPLFIGVAFSQVFIRDGFDLSRHPLSLLSLGDFGWVQIANFVLAGLLSVASAVGLRRVLHPGRAGTWGPLLVGIYGAALIAAGAFVADPSLGFPPGAPPGPAEHYSWHAIAHGIAAPLAFLSLAVACLVFVRRFAALRQWGWLVYSAATSLAAAVLGLWPNPEGISLRLAIGSALTFGWASAIAAQQLIRLATANELGQPVDRLVVDPARAKEPATRARGER